MSGWQLAGLALGGGVASLNFWLSFLAAPLHRLRNGTRPQRRLAGLAPTATVSECHAAAERARRSAAMFAAR
jgi:hypothetical protein